MSKTPPDVNVPDYLDEVFGPKGYLAQRVQGYQPRPGQISLARLIDQGIRHGRHVIAEGPTGVGKSLAYSVPASYHAIHSNKRILIVTSNKTLQAQIINKDLKDLYAAVPWKFSYAVRKGIGSYLCARDLRDERYLELDDPEAASVQATLAWANRTTTGDFEESPGPVLKIWNAFSTTNDDCDGPKSCRMRNSCFVAQAKRAAEGAHIVVTNYHLLYRHMNYVAAGMKSTILPAYDVAILDEVHNAPDIARDFLGEDATVTLGMINRCIAGLHLHTVPLYKKRCELLRHEIVHEVRTLWDDLEARQRAGRKIFEHPEECRSKPLEDRLGKLRELYLGLTDVYGGIEGDPPRSGAAAERRVNANACATLGNQCEKAIKKLSAFRTMKLEGMVYFIEAGAVDDKHGKPPVKLRARALWVGKYMAENLFATTSSVIQVSATLAIKGTGRSGFDFVKREMGMKELPNVDELVVPSPFDWPKNALLVIPSTMVPYVYENGQSDAFDAAVQEHFTKIVNMVKGRTMGLFTSYKLLEKVRDSLRKAKTPYEVLVQREATNRALQQQFRANISSVLLGTQSFAEGVDIQGEACTCVVLDKINFIPKDDPVLVGLGRKDKSVFSNYQVPKAIMDFKQRTGRLIRTVTDVGVIVLLDKRLLTKGYGKLFLDSLPPIQVSHDLADIAPFLRKRGAL